MRRSWKLLLAAAVLCLPGLARAAAFTMEPPPGWQDVTVRKKARRNPSAVIELKGPEKGSFVLTRVPKLSLENRAVARAFLTDVLVSINKRTGLGLKVASNLSTVTYDNGLTVHYLRADQKGKPRMILAVMEYGGSTMLGTLVSSVPDTLLPSILGSLRAGPDAMGLPSAREAQSLDGQLFFTLPRGFLSRPLNENERRLGFVLAVRGLDSELMVMKLVEESNPTPIKEQPQIVRNTVLSVAHVDPASLSSVKPMATPAGPSLVYASARVKDPAGPSQFVAGYMPWCYWGYSLLAKGPKALELMQDVFKNLALGPSAMPKLVKETPEVPVPRQTPRGAAAIILTLIAAAAVVFILVKKGAKAAPSPPAEPPAPGP